jgi:hypothetical protein
VLSSLIDRPRGSVAKRLKRIGAPVCEPINFDLQKSSLKVGNINASAFAIQMKIAAARTTIEKTLNRCLVQQEFDLFLDDETSVGTGSGIMAATSSGWYLSDGFSGSASSLVEIVLPLPPIQQVVGIWTSSNDGTETLVDPSVYSVSAAKEPCRIRLRPGQHWPSHGGFEAFRIRFTAGYLVPFRLSDSQPTVFQASKHGFQSGDVIQFSSIDNTVPAGLTPQANYTITNLQQDGFQVLDTDGNLIVINGAWPGYGFIGSLPANVIEALVLISGLNQGGEIRPKLRGAERVNSLEIPVDPLDLIGDLVWPVSIG